MKGTTQEPQLRLHGWSWMFKASTALKELALPLLAFLVLKREEELLLLGVTVGVALLALAWGLLRARSFRYEIRADEVVVRDGMLVRELRHVPFSRVQSVSERRGPVHRLLGVTELVLESGTGGKPEAVLQVLSPAAAAALAGALRLHRAAAGNAGVPPADAAAGADAAAAEPLLVLPTSELLRLGLVSNRGFVVVLMAAGAASQSIELLRALPGLRDLGPAIDDGLSEAAAAGLLPLALWLGALLLFALVLVRVLSLGHALLTQHGFTLTRDGTRLRVRRGLLTRIDVSGRTDAIQRLVLERNPLHRLFNRCSLRVDLPTAPMPGVAAPAQLDHLAPIATPAQARRLLLECLPGLDLDALDWRPLHPGATFWRARRTLAWVLPLALGLALTAALAPVLSAGTRAAGLVLAAAMPLAAVWHARRWVATARFAVGAGVLVWRSGVWTQRWVLLPQSRAQVTSLHRTPLGRRAGMARLNVDTMAPTPRRALVLRWLAEADAVALNQRLWRAGA